MALDEAKLERELGGIQQRLTNIESTLLRMQTTSHCRFLRPDGNCDMYEMLQSHKAEANAILHDHDRQINRWSGGLNMLGALYAVIGGLTLLLVKWLIGL